MIRLGVAVRILGRAGLRARDGRRAEHAPHLSVSLLLVRDVLAYLAEQQIGCYRLADNLAPYLTDERHAARIVPGDCTSLARSHFRLVVSIAA